MLPLNIGDYQQADRLCVPEMIGHGVNPHPETGLLSVTFPLRWDWSLL